MTAADVDEDFPHSLSVFQAQSAHSETLTYGLRTIQIPFPTHRLANAALRSLAVDQELSQLVKRDFSLVSPNTSSSNASSLTEQTSNLTLTDDDKTVLKVDYKATTPRMLRVAVNGFFESLSVVVQCMGELDIDVLHEKGLEGLEGVQGVEQGMTGSAIGAGG